MIKVEFAEEKPVSVLLHETQQMALSVSPMAGTIKGRDAYSPYISESGTWMCWDDEHHLWVDTGVSAEGKDGEPGPKGDPGPMPEVDATLSHSGAAADAKETGDGIRELRNIKQDKIIAGSGIQIADDGKTISSIPGVKHLTFSYGEVTIADILALPDGLFFLSDWVDVDMANTPWAAWGDYGFDGLLCINRGWYSDPENAYKPMWGISINAYGYEKSYTFRNADKKLVSYHGTSFSDWEAFEFGLTGRQGKPGQYLRRTKAGAEWVDDEKLSHSPDQWPEWTKEQQILIRERIGINHDLIMSLIDDGSEVEY